MVLFPCAIWKRWRSRLGHPTISTELKRIGTNTSNVLRLFHLAYLHAWWRPGLAPQHNRDSTHLLRDIQHRLEV